MIREVITIICFSLGFICLLFSAIGVLRFPDFLQRIHAGGIGDTLGLGLFCLGFIIHIGPTLVSVKVVLVLLALFLVNPLGTHLIGKSDLHSGRLKDIPIEDVKMTVDEGNGQE